MRLEVKQVSGQGRYDQIVEMIQRSEQMKSPPEAKASSLADRLGAPTPSPGVCCAWPCTRNVTRALSVLMVDFSCAQKLAHASGGAFRHAGGGTGAHHRQGRQVPGSPWPKPTPLSLTRPAPLLTPALE